MTRLTDEAEVTVYLAKHGIPMMAGYATDLCGRLLRALKQRDIDLRLTRNKLADRERKIAGLELDMQERDAAYTSLANRYLRSP